MSNAIKMAGPCTHDVAPRAWKGRAKTERDRKEDRGVAAMSYSGTWGCRSISSRSRPRDLRCSTMAGRPHQGSCKTEGGDIYTRFTLRWFKTTVYLFKNFPDKKHLRGLQGRWCRHWATVVFLLSLTHSVITHDEILANCQIHTQDKEGATHHLRNCLSLLTVAAVSWLAS